VIVSDRLFAGLVELETPSGSLRVEPDETGRVAVRPGESGGALTSAIEAQIMRAHRGNDAPADASKPHTVSKWPSLPQQRAARRAKPARFGVSLTGAPRGTHGRPFGPV